MAAAGALPPLIGRRKEMLKITQVLLQSWKNNLILVGEPGVGKTVIVEVKAKIPYWPNFIDYHPPQTPGNSANHWKSTVFCLMGI
jgi:hypothetical protein